MSSMNFFVSDPCMLTWTLLCDDASPYSSRHSLVSPSKSRNLSFTFLAVEEVWRRSSSSFSVCSFDFCWETSVMIFECSSLIWLMFLRMSPISSFTLFTLAKKAFMNSSFPSGLMVTTTSWFRTAAASLSCQRISIAPERSTDSNDAVCSSFTSSLARSDARPFSLPPPATISESDRPPACAPPQRCTPRPSLELPGAFR
mmetsp:Transcript_41188/g.97653  ORF Transcript_41188/g.97653 Transcript_41188/m.97653 type:complete len:200 (-) Transcript_41188:25-624(-)